MSLPTALLDAAPVIPVVVIISPGTPSRCWLASSHLLSGGHWDTITERAACARTAATASTLHASC